MPIKIFSGVVAMLLVIAYLLPPLLKLKDLALGAVIVIGVVLITVDLVQSFLTEED